MAKMRVHELAKELNIKSQEVIDTLNGTQFAVKNVQSGLEDEAQQIVRKKYAKTEAKKDAPKKEEPKKDEAKAADRPKKKASIRVIVTQDVLVRKIVLNRTKLTVCESEEDDIILTIKQILPKNAKDKDVTWESDDEDVVDVDDNGELSIGDPGTATIYVTADDEGGAYATCDVTVTEDTSLSDHDDDDDDDVLNINAVKALSGFKMPG